MLYFYFSCARMSLKVKQTTQVLGQICDLHINFKQLIQTVLREYQYIKFWIHKGRWSMKRMIQRYRLLFWYWLHWVSLQCLCVFVLIKNSILLTSLKFIIPYNVSFSVFVYSRWMLIAHSLLHLERFYQWFLTKHHAEIKFWKSIVYHVLLIIFQWCWETL